MVTISSQLAFHPPTLSRGTEPRWLSGTNMAAASGGILWMTSLVADKRPFGRTSRLTTIPRLLYTVGSDR